MPYKLYLFTLFVFDVVSAILVIVLMNHGFLEIQDYTLTMLVFPVGLLIVEIYFTRTSNGFLWNLVSKTHKDKVLFLVILGLYMLFYGCAYLATGNMIKIVIIILSVVIEWMLYQIFATSELKRALTEKVHK